MKSSGLSQKDKDAAFATRAMKGGWLDALRDCPLPSQWQDSRGETLLMRAVRLRCALVAERIAAKGRDLGRVDSLGRNALWHAAREGWLPGVELFAKPELAKCRDPGGWTPLMAAAHSGAAQCVSLLIPLSDMSQRDDMGCDALQLACKCGHADVVSMLMAAGSPLSMDENGRDPLMTAAFHGHADSVKALIGACDPKRARGDGWTALLMAAHMGHGECCRALAPVSDLAAQAIGSGVEELARKGFGRQGDPDTLADWLRNYALSRQESDMLAASVEKPVGKAPHARL